MTGKKNVAILIFEDVEVLDFCGPFEVFSNVGVLSNQFAFHTYTVAENESTISSVMNLLVEPNYTIRNCPKPDILIIPGGMGTRDVMSKPHMLNWIRSVSQECEYVLSVCTGALALARAGLLDGLKATTHYLAQDTLRSEAPNSEILSDLRFVDNGKVVTAAGVSSGIDMSFHVVAKILGEEIAMETAKYIEYAWNPAVEVG